MICQTCKNFYNCDIWKQSLAEDGEYVYVCDKYKPQTQFDRINAMNIDELAEFLMNVNNAYAMDCMCGMSECKHPDINNNCAICFKEWLESEVEE